MTFTSTFPVGWDPHFYRDRLLPRELAVHGDRVSRVHCDQLDLRGREVGEGLGGHAAEEALIPLDLHVEVCDADTSCRSPPLLPPRLRPCELQRDRHFLRSRRIHLGPQRPPHQHHTYHLRQTHLEGAKDL